MQDSKRKRISGTEQKILARIRKEKAKKQLGRCYWCGFAFTEENTATGDHLIPWSEGGSTNNRNVVAACAECNQFRNKIQSIKKQLLGGHIKRVTPVFWYFTLSDRLGL